MSALRTLADRPQLRAAALLLLLLAALAIALVAVAPLAAAVLGLAAAGGAGLLGLGVAGASRPRAAERRRAAPTGEAGPALRLTLPDGATVSARPVALAAEGEGTLLLTRDGYVVVDGAGRVIHRI